MKKTFITAFDLADKYHDWHFTLMKFTTHWRASFGPTPNTREEIAAMPKGRTYKQAIEKAMEEHNKIKWNVNDS